MAQRKQCHILALFRSADSERRSIFREDYDARWLTSDLGTIAPSVRLTDSCWCRMVHGFQQFVPYRNRSCKASIGTSRRFVDPSQSLR